MRIKDLRVRNKTIAEGKWNGLIVYRNTSIFSNYTWKYNPVSDDFPNATDNTKYFDFTRILKHPSSSYKTVEYINSDADDAESAVYRLTPNSHDRPAFMYFSFTLPAHTTIRIDGLLKGYSVLYQEKLGDAAVYITTTEPTSYINKVDSAEAVLYNETNYQKTGNRYYSSDLKNCTTTVTNNTDIDKKYYIACYVDVSTYSTNYNTGLVIKYLTFTKVA